jgi:hypothetical protein
VGNRGTSTARTTASSMTKRWTRRKCAPTTKCNSRLGEAPNFWTF